MLQAQNLLIATMEVNTPQANLDDVISYTITIKNISDGILSNIIFNNWIDKSLQVEENSIGVDEVVSSQKLINLELSDLMPETEHTVVYNTIVKRKPESMDNTLREQAVISFRYNGEQYELKTEAAITHINNQEDSLSYTVNLTSNQQQSTVGSLISYKGSINLSCLEELKNIDVSIFLSNNLSYAENTLMIAGTHMNCGLENINLNTIAEQCRRSNQPINIQFGAYVTSLPQIIRPLVSATLSVCYTLTNDDKKIISSEAVTEIIQPSSAHSYSLSTCWEYTSGLCPQISNVSIMPDYGNNKYSTYILSFTISDKNWHGNKPIHQSVEVQYPYNSGTQTYIWAQPLMPSCKQDNLTLVIYIKIVG